MYDWRRKCATLEYGESFQYEQNSDLITCSLQPGSTGEVLSATSVADVEQDDGYTRD